MGGTLLWGSERRPHFSLGLGHGEYWAGHMVVPIAG